MIIPKLVVFDTNQLNRAAKAYWQRSDALHEDAKSLVELVNRREVLPVILLEHVLEIFGHEDDEVIAARINYLSLFDRVFSSSSSNGAALGTTAQVYAVEMKQLALGNRGEALKRAVREAAFVGEANIQEFLSHDEVRLGMKALAVEHTEKMRGVVAVMRSPDWLDSDDRVLDAVERGVRTKDERTEKLAQISGALALHAAKFGDKRIGTPSELGREFFAALVSEQNQIPETDILDYTIRSSGIPADYITDETTYRELSRLTTIGQRSLVVSKHSGVDQSFVFEAFHRGLSHSFNIIEGVERWRDPYQRSKGSAFVDRSFVSVSPYVDEVHADGQTVDMVMRARRHLPFSKSIGNICKAKGVLGSLQVP